MEKSTVVKENVAGRSQQASMRGTQNVWIVLVFALDAAVTRVERRSDGSVRLSLGYKIQKSREKGSRRGRWSKSSVKKAGGCGGESGGEGVVPELPAGSQRLKLARHVDTEPGPDLKPPVQPEAKR